MQNRNLPEYQTQKTRYGNPSNVISIETFLELLHSPLITNQQVCKIRLARVCSVTSIWLNTKVPTPHAPALKYASYIVCINQFILPARKYEPTIPVVFASVSLDECHVDLIISAVLRRSWRADYFYAAAQKSMECRNSSRNNIVSRWPRLRLSQSTNNISLPCSVPAARKKLYVTFRIQPNLEPMSMLDPR